MLDASLCMIVQGKKTIIIDKDNHN
ncbi:hypothetical protein [Acinetobacter sp. MB5]|nr:hypothetical protein [Acinetobacter sp. MB5]